MSGNGTVNKVILIGRLGAEPETKYLANGQAVTNLRLATSEVWNDKNDQKKERTEWHRVQVWGKTAENAAKYLVKGQRVYVEGRLTTRSWDDKDGVTRYVTEIVASQLTYLDKPGGGRDDGYGEARGQDQGRGYGQDHGDSAKPRTQNGTQTTTRTAAPSQTTPAATDPGASDTDFADFNSDIPF